MPWRRTIYGTAVNNACKASGRGWNQVILSNQAERIYPTSQGGRVTFKPINIHNSLGGQIFNPPSDYIMLQHKPDRPSNPRQAR